MTRSDGHGRTMPIAGHLVELRGRLIKVVAAVLAGTALGLLFARPFLELLIAPMGDARPQSLRPTENIIVYFKVALILGLVLAMPVILYQILAFVVPGLTSKERRALKIVVPAATGLFALGVAFSAFIMLPFSVAYLSSFLSDLIEPQYSIDYYISFVFNFVLWIGLSFELPLVVAFLAYVGVVTPQGLAKRRRYAIVVIAGLAALITPTPDPFNMLVVMIPLYFLYEFGVLLARLTYRPRSMYSAPSVN
jgi:sec-independent protein translocase protein TatC